MKKTEIIPEKEKEYAVCDFCEKNVANQQCLLCKKDICNTCSHFVDGIFETSFSSDYPDSMCGSCYGKAEPFRKKHNELEKEFYKKGEELEKELRELCDKDGR